MTNIKLTVSGAKATAIVDGVLTSGSVGIPVTIEYDSIWDGLTKNLVCTNGKWRPTGTPRAILNIGGSASVAPEAMIADDHLYLGIEGRNADGTLVICTTWADCGTVFAGADTAADPSANPTPPIWSQLQQQINDLKATGSNSPEDAPVEPAENDIPKVFITGVKPTTKDDVLAEMQYISKTDNFHAYLEIKCQGTSSMAYAKKNFTVKLYSDAIRETKLNKDFKDWNHPGNKFVLKANWIDHSHARNIVSARLWNEVVKSRPDYETLPEEMRNSPRNGAVDGFPVKVYYNGKYEGIYTWNIGKDDWMWNMDEKNPNHVLLCAEGNTDGVYAETTSNFRALWNGVDGQKPGWSVEVGTNSTAVKTSLNNLIQFVMDNDGDAFRNGIGRYLDIQSAIDYYIFQYEVCGLDGLAHNMLLATYDGIKWTCGAYDLDATFGLWWNGSSFVSASYACPEDYQERYSLLWERIEANFLPELKARQAELRESVLSCSNMVTHFERFMDVIGSDLYAEDLTIYNIPSGSTNNIKQIRNFIRDRQAYVDAEFAAMGSSVPCTGISLDKSALVFTEEGAQTLTATVTPAGCTDPITWESDNTSIATVNRGIVTAIANGSTNITASCGGYSATCSVAVSDIAEGGDDPGNSDDTVDYTLNPLADVTWFEGQKYNGTTGILESAANEYCTPKLHLQNCMYNLTISGGTYMCLYMWDENENYVGRYEANGSAAVGKFMANPNWLYAVKFYSTSGFNAATVTLIPVNNSANAKQTSTLTFNTADITWSDTNSGTEVNISEEFADAGFTAIESINKTNGHHVFLSALAISGGVFYNNPPVFGLMKYNGAWLLVVCDSKADFVKTSGWTLALN